MTDRRRNLFVLLLVAGLLAASLFVVVTKETRLGLDLKGGVELVYQATPTGQTKEVSGGDIDTSINIIRERIDQLGVSEPEIQKSGADQISIGLPAVKNAARAEQQVGTTAQLQFYDWEPNLLPPNQANPTLSIFTASEAPSGGMSTGSARGFCFEAVSTAVKRLSVGFAWPGGSRFGSQS